MCQSHHKSGILCFAMHSLLSVGTCLKPHNLLPKEKQNKKKELLYIYLNNNIKFLKSALIPAQPLLQGWALSWLLTNCSLKPWTQVKVWKMKLMESHGCEGESLEIPAGNPAIPFEMRGTVLCTYSQVCPGKEQLQTEPGIVSVPPVWEANQGQRTVKYLQTRTTGSYGPDQQRAQPHSSSVLPNL